MKLVSIVVSDSAKDLDGDESSLIFRDIMYKWRQMFWTFVLIVLNIKYIIYYKMSIMQ